MTRKELKQIREKWIKNHVKYSLTEWDKFNYSILSNVMYERRKGRGNNDSYNDIIIMADTETSKIKPGTVSDNMLVAWTISLRFFNMNIVTLYGHKPSEFISALKLILDNLQGNNTIIYFHNLAYDWVFLRQHLMSAFGLPHKQLNTKSHNPILIQWENGLILKDSLILAQRSLDKWAKDMGVDTQKALGSWDYDLIRDQNWTFTADELTYIEHDTLAGVECLQVTQNALNKRLYAMPYTATGIPREEVRNRGADYHANDLFKRIVCDFKQQMTLEFVYHGGYTHANRHYINTRIDGLIQCKDFASSYPFVMLSEKYPMEKFTAFKNCDINFILRNKSEYAYMFKLIMIKPRLKNDFVPMPALQYSKAVKIVNPVLDNGRVLCAEYMEIYLTELDLEVIAQQYDFDKHICTEVFYSKKEYLPRWLTDYIFELFEQKTKLKGGDKVLYALAKAKLNSLYGMCVQKPIKDEINEDYLTGDYNVTIEDPEEIYNKFVKKHNNVLPYQWGVWVTAYAFRNLHKLGACVADSGIWLYSDTDSCYATKWNDEKVETYNNECKAKLIANGYGAVVHNNREYWLGIAENDSQYTEFKTVGAKRYCGRGADDNEIHITVAGVPKKGAKCLNDNIDNFVPGLIFSGAITGKKTHTYFYRNDVVIDEKGNELADSIDLSSCDYLLDSVTTVDWEKIFTEEIQLQIYEEDEV